MGHSVSRESGGTTLALLAAGFAIGQHLPNGLVDRLTIVLLVTFTIVAPLLLFYLIERF